MVAFVGGLAQHRAALDSPDIRVVGHPRTMTYLGGVVAELGDAELDLGFQMWSCGIDPVRNRVELVAETDDRDALIATIEARWPDAVDVTFSDGPIAQLS